MDLYCTWLHHVVLYMLHALYCTVWVLHWHSPRDKCLHSTPLPNHVLYLGLDLTLLRYLRMVLILRLAMLCRHVLEM